MMKIEDGCNMNFGSLFSGIGGIDLGLERAGMACCWQVDNDDFCLKVLNKRWPNVPKYGDIRDVGKENLETVDLIAGGFPCQPFSVAGKRRGTKDDRHLWPEMLRVISELKPTWVLGENVPGIIPLFLDQAISDLEAEVYTCTPIVLPACAFDAPHERSRVFIIAYSTSGTCNMDELSRKEGFDISRISPGGIITNSDSKGLQGESIREIQNIQPTKRNSEYYWEPLTVEPTIRGMDDGVPDRVDRSRMLGEAVVPQVAEFIGRIIMEANQHV